MTKAGRDAPGIAGHLSEEICQRPVNVGDAKNNPPRIAITHSFSRRAILTTIPWFSSCCCGDGHDTIRRGVARQVWAQLAATVDRLREQITDTAVTFGSDILSRLEHPGNDTRL